MTQSEGVDNFRIFRGKVDSLSLYEVTDSELNELERGGPDSLYLNFAILLFSTAVSFLISIITTDIKSMKTYCIFTVVTAVGFVGGIILGILWLRTRTSRALVIHNIRARMPKDNPVDIDNELHAVNKI
ncbi:MAG: hypothetical protein ABFD64_07465 [Armatimonadota bacterium]